jgi:U5 small nuclear ribonucleoprotein component
VCFAETVVDTSSIKCFAETPNKKNRLTMIAGPLERRLGEEIETEQITLDWPKARVSKYF